LVVVVWRATQPWNNNAKQVCPDGKAAEL